MVKRILLTAFLTALIYSLTGCGTIQGIGDDINWVGQKGADLIEGAAGP